MYKQEPLQAFSSHEYKKAHQALATRVAFMMGRKFEEGDWADVYCQARGIEKNDWSNLNIDIMHANQGIEQKMLCYRKGNILSACGETLMHPSATRSIRIASLNVPANEAMQNILGQYRAFLQGRENKVLAAANGYQSADMRTGWLLWQTDLHEFLYFEERTQLPNPNDYYAAWEERPAMGVRKASKNLWIYEKETDKKRYSVTTSAGAKIQPYFDVPAITSPHLYHFVVIGEHLQDEDGVRMWVTQQTYLSLLHTVGNDISKQNLSNIIVSVAERLKNASFADGCDFEKAESIIVSFEAYKALQRVLPGKNDDHSIQLLVGYLSSQK